MKKKSRAYNRRMSYLKARRKQRIDKEKTASNDNLHLWYNNLHQYSKNKIHCSCPLCRAKTRFNGLDIADLRKQEKMDYSEEEYNNCLTTITNN